VPRSFRGSPHRSQGRQTAWGDGPGDTSRAVVASTTPQFLGQFITPVVEGLTVIRIRGELQIQLTLATTARDGMAGAVGIGIATAAAVNAGIASVPTPITEQDSENWLWWQAFSVMSAGIGTGAAQNLSGTGSSHFRATIDTKAMRRFDSEKAIYAAIEVGVETGTASMDVRLDSRALVKLP